MGNNCNNESSGRMVGDTEIIDDSIAFKGFTSGFLSKCGDQKFEVGKTYEFDGTHKLTFCKDLSDVFHFYPISVDNNKNRYCVIKFDNFNTKDLKSINDFQTNDGDYESISITILKELNEDEIQQMGNVKIHRNENGCLHHDKEAALTHYFGNGKKYREEWYFNGEYHRGGDKPAITWYAMNKKIPGSKYTIIEREEYYHYGLLHREKNSSEKDYPAVIDYKGSMVCSEEYYLNDESHREDGPAVVHYNKKGGLKMEIWYYNDIIHRDDGPAITNYYNNGRAFCEEWWCNGVLHKIDNSPAVYYYYRNGDVKEMQWFVNGVPSSDSGLIILKYFEHGRLATKIYISDNNNLVVGTP